MYLYGSQFGPASGGYSWNRLYVNQFEDQARIWVQDPPIWELLADDGYLIIWGNIEGTVTSHSATMTLWGDFTYCPRRVSTDSSPRCAVAEVSCRSDSHLVTMKRQYH
jgi:hypothetical protein